MSHEIGMFELLLTGGGSIGAIGAAWIHMRISVANLKTEFKYLKEAFHEEKVSNKENYKEISDKMDSIFKKLSEINVSLAKK